jgi:DNA-binding PadR family transcriptional regulator
MREFLRGAVQLHSRAAVEEGRSRRVYKITPEGRKVLRRTRKALKELADEVLSD